jgi:hypothetical protein
MVKDDLLPVTIHAVYHFVPWHSKHDTPVVPPFKSEP